MMSQPDLLFAGGCGTGWTINWWSACQLGLIINAVNSKAADRVGAPILAEA
jgi:hypothetical protein